MKKVTKLVLGAAAAGVLLASLNQVVRATSLAPGHTVGAQISAGGIVTAMLADGSVTSAKIASGIITSAQIVDNGVTTNKIRANAVTTPKLLLADQTALQVACITTAKTIGTCTVLTAATGLCSACN